MYRLIAFLLGIYCGISWLLPVVGNPGQEVFSDPLSFSRVIRVVSPLLVWILAVAQKQSTMHYSKIHLHLFLSMCLVPLLYTIIYRDIISFVSSVIPLIISILIIVGFSIINETHLALFIYGVSLSSVFFLANGIITTGFESNFYYGRERVSFGFVHPLVSGSSIFASIIFNFISLYYLLNIKKIKLAFLRHIIVTISFSFFIFSMYMLWVNDSKNIMIMILIMIMVMLCKDNYRIRNRILPLLTTAIFIIYLVSAANAYSNEINDLFSTRLSLYNAAFSSLVTNVNQINILQILIGKAAQYSEEDSGGFSAIDSVYISFLLKYGLISAISLLLMIVSVGKKLSANRTNSLPYACFCGIVFLFAFDSQGINATNLGMFIVFAFPIKSALIEDM